MSNAKRNYIPLSNILLSTQLMILGCGVFLVFVEIGIQQRSAADIMMLCWLGALVIFLAPVVQNVVLDIRDWWSDSDG